MSDATSDFSDIPTAYPPATGFDSVYIGEVLTLSRNAVEPLEAVPLQQVEEMIGPAGPYLPLIGGMLLPWPPFSANLSAFDMTAANPGFVYGLGAQIGGITGTLAIPQNYGVVSFRNKGTTDTVSSPLRRRRIAACHQLPHGRVGGHWEPHGRAGSHDHQQSDREQGSGLQQRVLRGRSLVHGDAVRRRRHRLHRVRLLRPRLRHQPRSRDHQRGDLSQRGHWR